MQLQYRGGDGKVDGAFHRFRHGFRFVLAQSDQDHALRVHDGLDAHGDRTGRHFVQRREEPGVGQPGVLGQFDLVGQRGQRSTRFVESDVSVLPEALNPSLIPGMIVSVIHLISLSRPDIASPRQTRNPTFGYFSTKAAIDLRV